MNSSLLFLLLSFPLSSISDPLIPSLAAVLWILSALVTSAALCQQAPWIQRGLVFLDYNGTESPPAWSSRSPQPTVLLSLWGRKGGGDLKRRHSRAVIGPVCHHGESRLARGGIWEDVVEPSLLDFTPRFKNNYMQQKPTAVLHE